MSTTGCMNMASKHLVIGLGEVGAAVLTMLKKHKVPVRARDLEDDEKITGLFDVLHICFPYGDSFIKEVEDYKKLYEPRLVVIYTSCDIGTTRQIKSAVHMPVEGRHESLANGVELFPFLGFNDMSDLRYALEVFTGVKKIVPVENSNFTEFLKLASTSKYGINLAWAQFMQTAAESIGMSYEHVKYWDEEYNSLYQSLGQPQFQKFVLEKPNGKIGGHCVIPNAKLLNKRFPNELLDQIVSME